MSKKQENGVVRRLATQIKSLVLAHAFVLVRREGFVLRVAKIDGNPITPEPKETNPHRINVEIVQSLVRRAWIG